MYVKFDASIIFKILLSTTCPGDNYWYCQSRSGTPRCECLAVTRQQESAKNTGNCEDNALGHVLLVLDGWSCDQVPL